MCPPISVKYVTYNLQCFCPPGPLLSFDDKRYVLDDKVHTRAHGHYLNHLKRVMEDE